MVHLSDEFIQQLLNLYPHGAIEITERIGSRLSGATVLLVRIRGERGNDYNGFAFAKVDYAANVKKAFKYHQEACNQCNAAYIPDIIGEPLGPIEREEAGEKQAWMALLYESAHDSSLLTRSLARLLEEGQASSPNMADQLQAVLNPILACWHQPRDLSGAETQEAIPTLLKNMLNVGEEDRTRNLNERAKRFGATGRHHENLNFLRHGGGWTESLPNPIAYILNAELWGDRWLLRADQGGTEV